MCKIYRDLLAEYGRNKIFMLSLVYNELKIRFVVFFTGLEWADYIYRSSSSSMEAAMLHRKTYKKHTEHIETETIFWKKCIQYFSLAHGGGLWPILLPATRGQSRCSVHLYIQLMFKNSVKVYIAHLLSFCNKTYSYSTSANIIKWSPYQ